MTWQHAAEKSCHDIKYNGRNNNEYTIDTCAGIPRDSIYTRKDIGHTDSWHFVTHPRTCEIVMRHELNKLKFMDCMYLNDEQMQGWIELLTLGRSSSASSLTAADGSTTQPEPLSKLLVPPVIPFEPIFIPGFSARTTAEAPIIYEICDGDVQVDPDSHEPDAPGTVVPESPALPKTAPLAAPQQPAEQCCRATTKQLPPPVTPAAWIEIPGQRLGDHADHTMKSSSGRES